VLLGHDDGVAHEHRSRFGGGRRDRVRGAGDADAVAAAQAHLVARPDLRAQSRDHLGKRSRAARAVVESGGGDEK
jgi:hypothetical protein